MNNTKQTFGLGQYSTKSGNWTAHILGEVPDDFNCNRQFSLLVGKIIHKVDGSIYYRVWTMDGEAINASSVESDLLGDYTLVAKKESTPANPDAVLTESKPPAEKSVDTWVARVANEIGQKLLSQAPLTKPCNWPCVKCGSTDANRKHFFQGEDTLEGIGPSDNERSSDFVDREDGWKHPAKKECIVHTCRCCGYVWDTAPLCSDSSFQL